MDGKKARDQEPRGLLSSRAIRKRLRVMEVDLEKARVKRDRAQTGLEALELVSGELADALEKAARAERLAEELGQPGVAAAATMPQADPEPEPLAVEPESAEPESAVPEPDPEAAEPEPTAPDPEPESAAAEPESVVVEPEELASDTSWVQPEPPVRRRSRRGRHLIP